MRSIGRTIGFVASVGALAVIVSISGGAALAQVPVNDSAVLTQAQQTASNTSSIMQTNKEILDTVNKTLQAVTGDRSTGSIAQAALGDGFSMSGAPDFSSIIGGSGMSWGSLGQFGNMASQIINGLNLVQSLTGNLGGSPDGTDMAYQGAVNTAGALTGMISGAQSSSRSRMSAFQSAGGQIGSAADIKGSIDQNSQLQVQTGLTINELIGVVNGTNAALNAEQLKELAGQSKLSRVMEFDRSRVTLVGN